MIRNKATEAELKELEQTQGNLIWAIDMGYIKSFDELIDMMRKMYKKKWFK
jgi:transcriptional regulatory protein LevR